MGDEFFDPDNRPAEVALALPHGPGLPLLTQSSKWSCLPTSFAMVLAKDNKGCAAARLADIMEQLGRDDERGFHVQELLGIAVSFGWAFVPLDFEPRLERHPCLACHTGPGDIRDDEFLDRKRSQCSRCEGSGVEGPAPLIVWKAHDALKQYDAVLTGTRTGLTKPHAVAWCATTQKCLDPEVGPYGLEGFDIWTAWIGLRTK